MRGHAAGNVCHGMRRRTLRTRMTESSKVTTSDRSDDNLEVKGLRFLPFRGVIGVTIASFRSCRAPSYRILQDYHP
ncbi:hypothetical protein E2C01_056412 [Portunus trituberculatus]|uniref:Uncharacterized protein n=1 Tax=Portunus trituberculatus TaxID=210409 RepID=A0A5B7GZJ3_PORTR|nr:hypothetical protein [Portunus trituberculatus]